MTEEDRAGAEKIEPGSSRAEIYHDERHRFRPGNPGRPRGCRNKVSLRVEELLRGRLDDIVNAVIAAAVKGDTQAARLALDRIAPPRKDAPIGERIELPELRTAQDAAEAIAIVAGAVADGVLTPGEGAALTEMVRQWRESALLVDVERRLAALEGKGE